MTRITALSVSAIAATLVGAACADEMHLDVWMHDAGGIVGIGGIDEDGMAFVPGLRVFGAEFGEDPGLPYFADEPGFQSLDGDFSPFASLRVNIEDAVTSWTGSGFGATDATISMSYGPGSVVSGAGFVPGFAFSVDDEGGFHGHFDLEIDDDGAPAPGVYLLPLSLEFDGDPASRSDRFWFVMNLGMDESVHDTALDWVQTNLVPAPGALALLLGGLLGGRRRR